MKSFFYLLVFFSISAFAQLDSKSNSMSIPAVEVAKEPEKPKPNLPATNNSATSNFPKTPAKLELPKKEFSMFANEKFGNPGELYQKELNDELRDVKLSKEEVERRNGSTTDQYFGDFKSQSEFVNVAYRDHGYVDGDIVQVRVNDDIVHARVFLSGGFKGFKLDLKPGFNKIDFVALNQGESGPNTAEFRVIDDKGMVVTQNRWNLATGVKATVIVVKE
ncbi:hypothetical protein KFZ70_13010 [Tamlana fucoidanivorans]|uniref:Secreted protein n=1 Tax=Allotamlana fucoidanivorans TaxID=2583814 RepID=A0A5C4SE67_9FLAO|nr:hypothetical protein [Tamlana fucoidanivorans]TNJ41685.1 hypothetical protein FGF67_15485 [Tamlana fucoidanivorans]